MMMHYPTQLFLLLSLSALLGGCNAVDPLYQREAARHPDGGETPASHRPSMLAIPLAPTPGTPSAPASPTKDGQSRSNSGGVLAQLTSFVRGRSHSGTAGDHMLLLHGYPGDAHVAPPAAPTPPNTPPPSPTAGLPPPLNFQVYSPSGAGHLGVGPSLDDAVPPSPTSSCDSYDFLSHDDEGPRASEAEGQGRLSAMRRSWSSARVHAKLNSRIDALCSADLSASSAAKDKLVQSLLKHRSGRYIDLAMERCAARLTDSLPEHAYRHMLAIIEALIKAKYQTTSWLPILQRALVHESCSIHTDAFKLLAMLAKDAHDEVIKTIHALVCEEVNRLEQVQNQAKMQLRFEIVAVRQELAVLQASDIAALPPVAQEESAQALRNKEDELWILNRRSEVDMRASVHRQAGLITIFEILHWRGFTERPENLSTVVGERTYGLTRPSWLQES